jgi:hypothetical protein
MKFNRDTVNSVFAINGTGKSSVFDALCYAICGDGETLSDLASLFGDEAVRVDVALVSAELDPEQLLAVPAISQLVGVYIRSEDFDGVIGTNDEEELILDSPPYLPPFYTEPSYPQSNYWSNDANLSFYAMAVVSPRPKNT